MNCFIAAFLFFHEISQATSVTRKVLPIGTGLNLTTQFEVVRQSELPRVSS